MWKSGGMIAVMLLGVAGCTPSTINRTSGISSDTIVTTGARQRTIIRTQAHDKSSLGVVHPGQITCVEPSPDVAGTLASTVGFGAALTGKGTANLTSTSQEQLIQLHERTVAIDAILRNGYQNCLDYANGAITSTVFAIRTARLDDLIATLVLGQIAGGAFGRAGGSITNSGAEVSTNSSLLGSFGGLVDSISEASSQLAAAEKEVEVAQLALTNAKADQKTAQDAVEEAKNGTPEEQAEAGANLKIANDDVVVAEANLTSKERERDATKALLQGSIESSVAAKSGTATATGVGAISYTPNPQISAIMETMQENFLLQGATQSYMTACAVEMGLSTPTWYTSALTKNVAASDAGAALGQVSKRSEGMGKPVGADDSVKANADQIQSRNTGDVQGSRMQYEESKAVSISPTVVPTGFERDLYGSVLAEHCNKNLYTVIDTIEQNTADYRQQRIDVERERIAADVLIAAFERPESSAIGDVPVSVIEEAFALCKKKEPVSLQLACVKKILSLVEPAAPTNPAPTVGVAPIPAPQSKQ